MILILNTSQAVNLFISFLGGFAYCAFGWMSDYKGYWYHTTAPGCGTGTGFRDGSSAGDVGAYCCRITPILPREYVLSLSTA